MRQLFLYDVGIHGHKKSGDTVYQVSGYDKIALPAAEI